MTKTRILKKSLAFTVAIILCITAFIACPAVFAADENSATYSVTATVDKSAKTATATVKVTSTTACLSGVQFKLSAPESFTIKSVVPSGDWNVDGNNISGNTINVVATSETAATSFEAAVTCEVPDSVFAGSGVAYTFTLNEILAASNSGWTETDVTLTGSNSASINIGVVGYTFKKSYSFKATEPWAVRFLGRPVPSSDATKVLTKAEIEAFADYGAYILFDVNGTYSATPDVATIKANGKKFTKSSSYVNITTSGSSNYIDVTYSENVYTKNIDKKFYVVYFVKDADGEKLGDVISISLGGDLTAKDNILAKRYAVAGDKEKALITAMKGLYDATAAYLASIGA